MQPSNTPTMTHKHLINKTSRNNRPQSRRDQKPSPQPDTQTHQPIVSHRLSSQPPRRVLRHLPLSVQEQLPSSPRVSVMQPAPEHVPRSSHVSPVLSPVLQLGGVLLPQSAKTDGKLKLWINPGDR